jgi:hypothetical protein
VTERKTDAINLRMAPATKELLRLAASKERRTVSNMIDFLILDHCERNGILAASPTPKPLRSIKSKVKVTRTTG